MSSEDASYHAFLSEVNLESCIWTQHIRRLIIN